MCVKIFSKRQKIQWQGQVFDKCFFDVTNLQKQIKKNEIKKNW